MTTPRTSYRTIPLTQGQVALVSECDYARISLFKWCAHWVPSSDCFRAMRREGGGPTSLVVYMHRDILLMENGDPRLVDHVNGDGLDNRRENIRIADKATNAWNSRTRSDNTSGVRGVSWDKKKKMWQSVIVANKKRYWLGYFENLNEAIAVRLDATRKLYGEFARTK